jgi:alkaline phosphatase
VHHLPFVQQLESPTPEATLPEPTPEATETTAPAAPEPGPPFRARHVIVFIGDGMGFEQVKAAGMYLHGAPGRLSFEQFPYQAEMTTHPANDGLTDSAATSTAMATGEKVNTGVIGLALPGDGRELYTLLEYARDYGLSTGLVTTSPITHATPAGFGAHAANRTLRDEIAADYLNQTRPNLLLGGGAAGMDPGAAAAAGYTVVANREELLALDTESATYVSGQFGAGQLPYEVNGLGDLPHLWEMTDVALRILDNDPDGLFVMIEGGLIDTAAHANDLAAMVGEVVEFDRAIGEALDWAARHPDTLILVTADHETGGLSVLQNNGQGSLPGVSWSTSGHTPVNVPLYLTGLELESFPGLLDNIEIPALVSDGRFSQP